MGDMPRARLHLPHSSMFSCIHLAVERDTRGAELSDAERFNYFPATPFPTLSWIFEGDLHMVEDARDPGAVRLSQPMRGVVFAGPRRRPSASWSPGPVYALTVSFYPEALSRLLGIDIQKYLDAILPLGSVLSRGGLEPLLHAETLEGDEPYLRLQDMLRPHWRNRPAIDSAGDLRGWLASLASRAAFAAAGGGLRQLQRRVKDWTGQSYRDLQLYARVEEAMCHGAEISAAGGFDLAAIAAETGFSDQSHLGRKIRRVTGLSPAKLNALVRSHEAFWFYGLLGARSGNGGYPIRKR